MFVDNISSIIMGGTGCLVAGTILGWQLRRRRSERRVTPTVSQERRDSRTGAPLPNRHPSCGAVDKSEAVKRFEEVNVVRPTMLVFTSEPADPCAGQLFVQRTFKSDRAYWKPIALSQSEKSALNGLFAHICKLSWVPGSVFERHIYAVSFAPELESRLMSGDQVCLTEQKPLKVCAIDQEGRTLGESMDLSGDYCDYSNGLQALWNVLNPRTRPHALADELKNELEVLKSHTDELADHVSDLTARKWSDHVNALEELTQRVNVSAGDRLEQPSLSGTIKNLAAQVREEAQRIDRSIVERAKGVQSLDDADLALQHAISFMYVRELAVRVLRICALLTVIAGEEFEDEVVCANRIVEDLNDFPDVSPLIRSAGRFTHRELDRAGRTMNDLELSRLGSVKRHAEELIRVHDAYVKQLRDEIDDVQARIDQCVLAQGRPGRYAVRVDDFGRVEEVFVLES